MSENIPNVIVPPLKCQGIKTKLIPFIRQYAVVPTEGRWIEPFMGTGVVAFNLAPQHALLTDKNQHIINFYKAIQDGTITPQSARSFLERHGALLAEYGETYYREMREAFNECHDPLHFLFLNRADYNGLIRFNRSGAFNVPFCKNANRFSPAYISKICNQIAAVRKVMEGKDWDFRYCSWQDTMKRATDKDFIYLDPPYIGRDTTYVGEWSVEEAVLLSEYAHNTTANIGLSLWKEDEVRRNEHLFTYWSDFTWYERDHFYHVGPKAENRHPVVEVFAVKQVRGNFT